MAMIPITSKFNFYQQIRVLLSKLRNYEVLDDYLLDDKLQIISDLSMDSPDGQIKSISQRSPDDPIEVIALYNGLTGVMGALPMVYSEWMIERHYRYSDYSAKAFINIFDHRLHCLDFLAWQKSHLYALAETQKNPPHAKILLAMVGLLNTYPPLTLIQYVSLFSSPVRSMANLELWLCQVLNITVKIKPFTGSWRKVAKSECCQVGNKAHKLKMAPMLGLCRIEVDAHFDVILGPMLSADSLPFLPKEKKWHLLYSSIRTYVGPVIDFSLSLIIDTSDLQPKPLGKCAIGIDYCLGHNQNSLLYKKRFSSLTFRG